MRKQDKTEKRKLTGKEKKELGRRLWATDPRLDVVHHNAAGIDVGSTSHYVAVPPDRDTYPVQEFQCFTADLRRLAQWLKGCGIETVAMQSTGVYWIPLYDILEEEGFEVYLVNAQHTKNLPGRKSDVQESQWLLKLHTYGLLRNSFRPGDAIRVLRQYWRQRDDNVKAASSCVQRIQKAMTEMNLQLANVISDITGWTGQRILRAIVAGERDPHELAAMKHYRIEASEEEIVRSLEGNWRPELLFVLEQELKMFDAYQQRITECDQRLQNELKKFTDRKKTEPGVTEVASQTTQIKPNKKVKKVKKPKGNAPQFDLASELHRISGVDLTRIDGIDVMTTQTVISELGLDMSRWPTEAHFASFLGLCPDNRISGGKVLKKGTRKVVNRAATALRMAASTLRNSQSYLGAQFRRLRTKLGEPKAITAMAHKLARLVYRMLKYGQEYVDKGMEFYQQKYRQQRLLQFKRIAQELGVQLPEIQSAK